MPSEDERRRARWLGKWGVLLAVFPVLIWGAAVAADQSDYSYPGYPWVILSFIGIGIAPFALAPLGWSIAVLKERAGRWRFVLVWCLVGSIINGGLELVVPPLVYLLRH